MQIEPLCPTVTTVKKWPDSGISSSGNPQLACSDKLSALSYQTTLIFIDHFPSSPDVTFLQIYEKFPYIFFSANISPSTLKVYCLHTTLHLHQKKFLCMHVAQKGATSCRSSSHSCSNGEYS